MAAPVPLRLMCEWVEMTVRVRRAGWTALVILAGASLLSRSMSLASGGGGDDGVSTFSLRVQASEPAAADGLDSIPTDQSGLWAIPAPTWFVNASVEAHPFGDAASTAPDAIRLL